MLRVKQDSNKVCLKRSLWINLARLYFSVYEGDRDGMYGGRYYCDYTKSGIRRLMSQFDNAEILDIWTTDDVRQDISDRQWLNVLVKKEEE